MGLLARAYINGAGYDLKDTDGVSFLEKAYDTATTMINNKAIYEWYMHPALPMYSTKIIIVTMKKLCSLLRCRKKFGRLHQW